MDHEKVEPHLLHDLAIDNMMFLPLTNMVANYLFGVLVITFSVCRAIWVQSRIRASKCTIHLLMYTANVEGEINVLEPVLPVFLIKGINGPVLI